MLSYNKISMANTERDNRITRANFPLSVHLNAGNTGGCCFSDDLGRDRGIKLELSTGLFIAYKETEKIK